jgi:hypothetical protein
MQASTLPWHSPKACPNTSTCHIATYNTTSTVARSAPAWNPHGTRMEPAWNPHGTRVLTRLRANPTAASTSGNFPGTSRRSASGWQSPQSRACPSHLLRQPQRPAFLRRPEPACPSCCVTPRIWAPALHPRGQTAQPFNRGPYTLGHQAGQRGSFMPGSLWRAAMQCTAELDRGG